MLNVVFIDRVHAEDGDPLEPVREALRKGASLVLFPEGTRTESELPQTFKSGLYYLAKEFPDLNLVPVYLENLHRILPKGSILPVPLINKVHFGPTLIRITGEDKQTFLARARLGVCELSQGH
jgi:1-acyl-sn-glycerol-3-phosphate acyltransferase